MSDRTARDPVVVAAVRSPIGKRGRAFAGLHAVQLAATVLADVVARVGLDPALVDEIIVGCNTQIHDQGFNVARQAALAAGFPVTVPACTVNRMCASGDQAAVFAAQAILAGEKDVVIAAGLESMSRAPMGADGGGHLSRAVPKLARLIPQGLSAELVCEQWRLARAELDAFAHESHRRATTAWESGRYDREIVPVPVASAEGASVLVTRDEGPRPDADLAAMAALAPAFKPDGLVTAGNSSQMSDGAAALLVVSRARAAELGLAVRGRLLARATVGSDPRLQLTGPIGATQKALARVGLRPDDVDVFEINEAFAAVVLAWHAEIGADLARVNPNGGAIALGHPLGATGARLLVSALHELERRGGRYALTSMCVGHGMGNATILEVEG